jgi:hypothetical protein
MSNVHGSRQNNCSTRITNKSILQSRDPTNRGKMGKNEQSMERRYAHKEEKTDEHNDCSW